MAGLSSKAGAGSVHGSDGAGRARPGASGGCGTGHEPSEAGHVGDQFGETQPRAGAGEADRTDHEAEPALLGGEDVLDRDPDPRPAGVAADHVRRHHLATRLRALECGKRPRRASRATLAAER